MFKIDKVKKVIFNPPATIVYWFDGTKTVVKTLKDEIFDKEKGFAMACAKKFFGNKGNYYNEFKKHGADNHCYSISIDLAHPSDVIGKVVKSCIDDGVSYNGNGSVSMSPNKIRELAGFPPAPDTDTKKSERIQKHVKEKVNVLCDELERFGESRDLEVSICNRSVSKCYEFTFEYGHYSEKSITYIHQISYEDVKEKSVIWLAATIEDDVSKWLDELYIKESE